MRMSDFTDGGLFWPVRVAHCLQTTRDEIARTLELEQDALWRPERIKAAITQIRLREMLEVLDRVEPRTGSAPAAYAWFRSEPLPGIGNQTPRRLVCDGNAWMVHAYLDRVTAGGYG